MDVSLLGAHAVVQGADATTQPIKQAWRPAFLGRKGRDRSGTVLPLEA